MRSRSLLFVTALFSLVACAQQAPPKFTFPLPTGVKLDPAGTAVELGSLPINLVLAPEGDRVVVVLSGWREQGIQVVDLKTRAVTQTIKQDAGFYGAVFSPDGKRLYVSGGNEDLVYVYTWANGAASLEAKFILGKKKEDGTGSSYPAGLAVSNNGAFLYVVENVGNGVAVVDTKSGKVKQRFPTERYPYAALSSCGHVYVSAWGGNTLSEFRERKDGQLAYVGRIEVGRHPSALAASGCGTVYATLAGSDRVAVVDTKLRRVGSYLHDSAPLSAPNEGSTPNAITVSGTRVYVAEADNNAVAVFERGRLAGRISADWYATGVLQVASDLLMLSGKGHGTHANPDGPVPLTNWPDGNPTAYALGQLNGSLRILPAQFTPAQLAAYTQRVVAANNWQQPRATARKYPPFKHVIYIIKENRTYDQVLGDMKEGDGDAKLVYFPDAVAPNHRALARRFGLWDRFFVNAEVSSQGHIWSTTAYITDFGEKTVPSGYAGKYPYIDGDEAGEPEHGFLWTLARKSGVTFRDYGEMVPGGWPNTPKDLPPDIAPAYKPFDLTTPDQERIDAWLAEFKDFIAHDNMPQLELMHLPNDHLAAGRPGKCTPAACMADNDLALARLVQAVSQSPRWQDTVIFVVEDDAQAGPDHVDSHRAPFYAISAYSKPGTIHRFANTTDVIAAIEDILHMGRLSKYDYFSRSLADVFSATPDMTPYTPLIPKQSLNDKNPPKTTAAKLSEGLDLSAPDRIDDQLYNYILWVMLKGDEAQPAARASAPLHALQSSQ